MRRRGFLLAAGGAIALTVAGRRGRGLAPWRVVPRLDRGAATSTTAPACLFCGVGAFEQALVASGDLHFTPCCLELAALIFEEDPPSLAASGRACCRCGARSPLVAGPAHDVCRACVDESAAVRRALRAA